MDSTILSKKQIEVLETLKKSIQLNSSFYLAGGTGLALLLSHRRSVDFDFFSAIDFFPLKIIEELKKKYDSAFSESVALKALTYFNDAEEEELPEGIRYPFSWDEIKRDLIKLSYEYFNQQIKNHKI